MLTHLTSGDIAFLKSLAEAISKAVIAKGDGGEYDLELANFPGFPRNRFAREQLIQDLQELLRAGNWVSNALVTEISVAGSDLHINRYAPA